ncbi:MAG: hypothetical protein AMS21_00910 [Gemmatimonas sp. SG8_38_2]|nr:MAG: hypothetical protein AMS21_00910 [Gemmatimonas sp. SG8_38_2]
MAVDREIIDALEEEAIRRAEDARPKRSSGVVRGVISDALDAATKGNPAPDTKPAPAQPQQSMVTTPVPQAEQDNDDDDYGDDESVSLYSNVDGFNQAPQLPAQRTTPALSGSIEDRVAYLEEQNRMLMAQIEQLPTMLKNAVGQLGAAGNNGGGQAPGGGLTGMLGNVGALAAMGKQLGLFGGEEKPKESTQFLSQMAEFLNIQNAMESLQMKKLNNTTVWLARMFRSFGKEALAKFAEETEHDAATQKHQFDGYLIPPGDKSGGDRSAVTKDEEDDD